eukprot:SAG31_NODE_4128_length_3557_cov_1.191440_2_plen_85_part_00
MAGFSIPSAQDEVRHALRLDSQPGEYASDASFADNHAQQDSARYLGGDSGADASGAVPGCRLESIDILRGVAIALMIFVDDLGW